MQINTFALGRSELYHLALLLLNCNKNISEYPIRIAKQLSFMSCGCFSILT